MPEESLILSEDQESFLEKVALSFGEWAIGETKNGDGREKRGMKVEKVILHWPSPPGSHHSHASWTRMLQSQYLPVSPQNPTTGD